MVTIVVHNVLLTFAFHHTEDAFLITGNIFISCKIYGYVYQILKSENYFIVLCLRIILYDFINHEYSHYSMITTFLIFTSLNVFYAPFILHGTPVSITTTGKSGLRSILGPELSPVYSLVNVTMLMIQRV